jgi:alpha-mannosidase
MPTSIQVRETGPLRVALEVQYRLSANSKLTQTISLTALSGEIEFDTVVEWHEGMREPPHCNPPLPELMCCRQLCVEHKFLKVEFPWNVRSPVACYEIPFGFIQRPTVLHV